MARRLCRMKVLDPARLLGYLVLIVDATGLFCWRRRHCAHCLTQTRGEVTLYQHQVLEAKLLGPAGVVVSVGSEFIDNRDVPADPSSQEAAKQDCELKALDRLAPQLKRDFPQLSLVLAGDSLYACGRVLAIARQYDWHYVLTLKEGRLPTVWDEFQRLLPLCPRNVLVRTLEDGIGRSTVGSTDWVTRTAKIGRGVSRPCSAWRHRRAGRRRASPGSRICR